MKQLSVTQILNPFNDFSMVEPHVLRMASHRGQVIHSAAAAYVNDLFFFVPGAYKPYLESFKTWYDRYVVRAIFAEKRLSDDDVYYFNGKPDLLVVLETGQTALVDLKSTYLEMLTWKSQIAAYKYLIEKNMPVKIDIGMTLCLNKEGKKPLAKVYHNPGEDFQAFIAALVAYRYFKK